MIEAAIRIEGTDLLINVKARPGARTDRIRGIKGGLLQVDVAAPPEDGKATERRWPFWPNAAVWRAATWNWYPAGSPASNGFESKA
ncbi:DUF167 domain-containing protein [Sandaracinobacter neustonicus]|uniref:DUF167 domain-containing protein n=1 Tax=Sandaracinobacter neustonicus TaxID=1715348 RepID=A0A501XDR8_9SPHN|nr:DUF167 family protein [Sandaracinobacter neustonicus]TPE58503.1 DUF167 domain-containing protein [Sandaracinobacter neustonicus]